MKNMCCVSILIKFFFKISFENMEKSETKKLGPDRVEQILQSVLPQVTVMQLSLFLVSSNKSEDTLCPVT